MVVMEKSSLDYAREMPINQPGSTGRRLTGATFGHNPGAAMR
jgi:hypothetical protein